tara:strand:- start:323 stop:520 length:198 start_codon:yes stop_codon:yes gene_type:complete
MSKLSKKGTREKSVAKTKKAFDRMFSAMKLVDKITTGAAMPPKGQAMGGYMKRNDGGMAKKIKIF